jgi:hypothetical protein
MSNDMVTIAQPNNVMEAEMIRGFLETNGVPALVNADRLFTTRDAESVLLRTIRVQVMRDDADLAVELLQNIQPECADLTEENPWAATD